MDVRAVGHLARSLGPPPLPGQEVIAEQIDTMRFLPPVPGVGSVQAEALEPAIADAVLGNQAPADALGTAAEQATNLMEENLESFGG